MNNILSNEKLLQNAVELVSTNWIKLTGSGDANTIDLYYHAKNVEEFFKIRLPADTPDKDIGISIVESVEKNFVNGFLIRNLQKEEIARRAFNLINDIKKQDLLRFEIQINYVVSLYMWHGCINMAKCTRKSFVGPNGEELYNSTLRETDYFNLNNNWENEEKCSHNVWIRYGVSLAKQLSENRGDEIINDWIPKDSPYWQ